MWTGVWLGSSRDTSDVRVSQIRHRGAPGGEPFENGICAQALVLPGSSSPVRQDIRAH